MKKYSVFCKLQIYLIFIFILCVFPSFIFAQGYKVETIVIDAGHGGHDPGAVGKNSKEKDIALSIALKTGKYIEKNIPNVKIIYTRTTDKFIELHKRAKIANENHADIFISIHCNKHYTTKPKGAETFVLGLHRTQANLNIAKTENAVILLEEDHETQYEGFDPNKDEGYITLSLLQSSNIENSIYFADLIQKQFTERVGRTDRSVKQAGFLVLYKTTMPGVLIETGFLSNSEEEKFLLSEKGQVYMASAIYRALKDFINHYENSNDAKIVVEENNLITESEEVIVEEVIVEEVSSTDLEQYFEGLSFYIQIVASSKEIDMNMLKKKSKMNIDRYYQKGLYKYVVGGTINIDNARITNREMKKKGFKDSFIVFFLDGKRISWEEAKQIM